MSSERQRRGGWEGGDEGAEADHGRPAPGKVTLTMRLAGMAQAKSAGAGPGKASLTSRLRPGRADRTELAEDTPPAPAEDQPSELPYRAEMERHFGQDFADVRAHVGMDEPLASLGARAVTDGTDIAFAAASPDRETVAHELTHVVQHRQHGGEGLAARAEVAGSHEPAEQEAEHVAALVAAGGVAAPIPVVAAPAAGLHLDRGRRQDGGERARKLEQTLEAHNVQDLRSAQISTWSTTEQVGDAEVRIDHEYVYALTGDLESGTESLLVAKRTMHIVLLRGTRFSTHVEVEVSGSARYDSNLVPSDLERVARTWPAIVASHGAQVRVQRDSGAQHAALHGKPHGRDQTLAHTVAHDPLLSYEASAEQRIVAVRELMRRLSIRNRNEEWLGQVEPQVAAAVAELDAYVAAIREQQDNFLDPVAPSRVPLEKAAELLEQLAASKDSLSDPEARRQANEAFHRLRSAYHRAERERVPEAALGAGVVMGFAEMGAMARDLLMKGADELGERTGWYDLEWEAASGIGKMREQGKDWGEITVAIVDGMIDQVEHAITEAANGNFTPLANLGLELAVDALIPAGAVGGVAKGTAAAGRATGRALKRAQTRLAQVTAKAKDALAKLGDAAPAWVRDELDAVRRAAADALHAPEVRAAGAGGGDASLGVRGLFEEFSRGLQRARLELSICRARQSLAGRGLGNQGNALFVEIERLATEQGLPRSAINALVEVIDGVRTSGDAAGLIKALEQTLPVAAKFDSADFARILRRAARAPDPVDYLDAVRWLGSLGPEARQALAPRIGRGHRPDLLWLREEAKLSAPELEALATDPATDWGGLQRRAEQTANLPPEVRAVIGKHIDDVTTAPPGTVIASGRDGARIIRWAQGAKGNKPALTLDSDGRITINTGNELNRAALVKNMRQVGAKLPGHQDHHIVPIEVARDHDVFSLARTRGEPRWDPNASSNGIQLPSSAQARVAVPESASLPIHSGNHPGYTKAVRQSADAQMRALIERYGSLEHVPPQELTAAARRVEARMRKRLMKWPDEELQ